MISFRYHLVSIVAVFLALAVGILMGTTVIKQGIIDQLKRSSDNAIKNSNQLRTQVSQLQAEIAVLNRFMTQSEPQLITGRLTGRTARATPTRAPGCSAASIKGSVGSASTAAPTCATTNTRTRCHRLTTWSGPQPGSPRPAACCAPKARCF